MRRYFIAVPSVAMAVSACMNDKEVTSPAEFAPPSAAATVVAADTNRNMSSPSAAPDRSTTPWHRRFQSLGLDSLWAEIAIADGTANVGLRHPGDPHGMNAGRVLVARASRGQYADALVSDKDLVVVSRDTLLPIVRVKIGSKGALARLLARPTISYVEPAHFVEAKRGRSVIQDVGCSVGAYSGPVNGGITPGDVLPWNLSYMQVPDAWKKVNGAGVTVGLVDTGVDDAVTELNSLFSSSMSSGRSITRTYSWVDPLAPDFTGDDQCGHGTRMAGVIAAPRNGQSIVGVAWKANLYSVRANDGVAIDLSDVTGYQLGIRKAAQNSRIVAMALGGNFHYQAIEDELAYWYYTTQVLFVVAAGTSPCILPGGIQGVLFPGTLNHLVTTVTRFDETGNVGCDSHTGSAVDFAAYGGQPTTGLGMNPPLLAGLAGSSNGVAVIAGLAALVLSRDPNQSRQDILNELIYAASPTGYLSSTWGWGVPNAFCAVRGMCRAWVEGTHLIESTGTYTFTAKQAQSTGPFSYKWSTGATTPTIQQFVQITNATQEYILNLTVTITDLSDGTQKTVTKSVVVRQPFGGCPTCL